MRQEQKFTLGKPMRRNLIVLLSLHAQTHTQLQTLTLPSVIWCVVLGTPGDSTSPETA